MKLDVPVQPASTGADGGTVGTPHPGSEARRVCCVCQRQYGEERWPWSGEARVVTSGLCSPKCELIMLRGLA